MSMIQYTIRSVSPSVDDVVNRLARTHKKSKNDILNELLRYGASAKLAEQSRAPQFSQFTGRLKYQSDFDAAMKYHDTIPPKDVKKFNNVKTK